MKKPSRSFLVTMLSLAIPVALQNLLFSSFTLIDTVMVGSLGDLPLAAVGMAGKWSWFLNIVLFGCTSGAAVFIAQYFGAQDTRGIHRTYGLMSLLTLGSSALFALSALLAEDVQRTYQAYYQEHSLDRARPYEGIPELLEELQRRGVKLCVFANKPHADT